MTSLYGHKFASQFGDRPCPDWSTVLIGITGRQMADGLNKCLSDYPEWPPGAAQFRALCLGLNPRNTDSDGNDSTWQHAKMIADTKRWDDEQAQRRIALADPNKQAQSKAAAAKALKQLKDLGL